MFNQIQNPETGRWVSIHGTVGKKVLNNYVRQMGGACPFSEGDRKDVQQMRQEANKAMAIDLLKEILGGEGGGDIWNEWRRQMVHSATETIAVTAAVAAAAAFTPPVAAFLHGVGALAHGVTAGGAVATTWNALLTDLKRRGLKSKESQAAMSYIEANHSKQGESERCHILLALITIIEKEPAEEGGAGGAADEERRDENIVIETALGFLGRGGGQDGVSGTHVEDWAPEYWSPDRPQQLRSFARLKSDTGGKRLNYGTALDYGTASGPRRDYE